MAHESKSQGTGALRGFASMEQGKQREIARKGGANVPHEKRSFAQDRTLAAEAGRKGGRAVKPAASQLRAEPRVGRGGGTQGRPDLAEPAHGRPPCRRRRAYERQRSCGRQRHQQRLVDAVTQVRLRASKAGRRCARIQVRRLRTVGGEIAEAALAREVDGHGKTRCAIAGAPASGDGHLGLEIIRHALGAGGFVRERGRRALVLGPAHLARPYRDAVAHAARPGLEPAVRPIWARAAG